MMELLAFLATLHPNPSTEATSTLDITSTTEPIIEPITEGIEDTNTYAEDEKEALFVLIQNTVLFYNRLLDIFPSRDICVSFNGGKDACAMLFLLLHTLSQRHSTSSPPLSPRELMGDIQLVHFNPEADFPQVTAFLHQVTHQLDIPLRVFPAMQDGVHTLVGEGRRLFFLGTRKGDPYTEKGAALETSSGQTWPSFLRAHPLFDWDYHQVWHLLKGGNLPYCELYDQGYTSIGTRFDTVPNEALRDEEGNFQPAYCLTDVSLERSNRRKRTCFIEHEGEEKDP